MTTKRTSRKKKETTEVTPAVETSVDTKATEKVAPVNSLVKGPTYVDGVMHLCESDLLNFELAQERVQNILQTIRLQEYQAQDIKRKADESIRQIASGITQLQAAKVLRESELLKLREELSARYHGLDWTKASYDDKTGKIFVDAVPLRDPE